MITFIIISIASATIGGIFAILGVVAGGFITYFCSIQLQNRNRFNDAKEKFRNAIHSVAVGLPKRAAGYFTLDDVARVKDTVNPIDLACRNFSPFLNERKRVNLEQTMQTYHKTCNEDIPQRQRDWTEYVLQCAAEEIEFITPNQMLETHIDVLLSFVDKT